MATSVAAFVGYSARGVTDAPVQVNSWGDYVQAFGGLDVNSPMSYAAYLFFLNGGSTAQVVRAGDTTGKAAPARIALSSDILLTATSPGSWGNQLPAVVDSNNLSSPKAQFNLTITDPTSSATERYGGLSLAAGPQGIAVALAASALMNVDPGSKLTHLPAAGDYTVPAKAPASSSSVNGGPGRPGAETPARSGPVSQADLAGTVPVLAGYWAAVGRQRGAAGSGRRPSGTGRHPGAAGPRSVRHLASAAGEQGALEAGGRAPEVSPGPGRARRDARAQAGTGADTAGAGATAEVTVTIGRIDVRVGSPPQAAAAAQAPRTRSAGTARPAPAPLDAYLHARSTGRVG